jgi:O-antigen/teichoic acid export membrane protein
MDESRDLALGDRSLREHTARGTIVNGAFLVAVNSLGLLRGFIVAGFLTASDYGVWGIVVIAFGTLSWLKQIGVSEKYVQQADVDQELAFQRAFTVELVANALFVVAILVAIPIAVVVYGQHAIVGPALALCLVVPAYVLQTPIWIFYRRMDFVRQRTLQALDPVVSFVVTVALAVAGAGYWAFLVGLLAGGWANALVVWRASPYRMRWRWHAPTVRSYASFSWPLFVTSVSGILVAQGSVVAASRTLGLAGVGAITLATTIALYVDRVDEIVTQTVYPAICAVQDRLDLLFETFVKSNRLALMWGLPFGIGVALFAADLVHYGIGDHWAFAIGIIQLTALATALHHVGFNWHAFYRARGVTRPLAVASVATAIVFGAVTIPLLVAYGLRGYGIGLLAVSVAQLGVRGYYLAKLFEGFRILPHAARSFAPSVLPAAAILGWRALATPHRTPALAVAEAVVYLALTAACTAVFERDLLREVRGYLRSGRGPGGYGAVPWTPVTTSSSVPVSATGTTPSSSAPG